MVRLNLDDEIKQSRQNWSSSLPEPVRRGLQYGSHGLYAASLWATLGFQYFSRYAWVAATAAIVLYLPVARVLYNEAEMITSLRVR